MSGPETLRRAIYNPHEIALAAHNNLHRRVLGSNGIDVMERDWDTLVILDACRFDLFEKANTLPGNLTSVISHGSKTSEFLRRNFEGQEYRDTVYVTANPMHELIGLGNPFHDIVPVWQENCDEEYDTVLPETFSDRVLEAHERYPHKRVIAHYNQPHIPFIGEHRELIEDAKRKAAGETGRAFNLFEHTPDRSYGTIWHALSAGYVDRQTIFDAFVENLELALQTVEQLISSLDRAIVVTSDHGNVIGERGPFNLTVYDHPYRVFISETVKVPWLRIENKARPKITADRAKQHKMADQEIIEERLEDLGYV